MELKIKKRNDILLIGVLLFCAICLLLCQNIFGKKGANVLVMQDGVLLYKFSLEEELCGENAICIESNEGFNVLEIQNGEASIVRADCPDGLCMKQKSISKQGESLICLPHRLVITVEGAEQSEIDSFAY